MSDNVSKVKERLNIVDVIGGYIKLDRAGINLKACCPFHNEKTPSFFVSPDRGSFKCFGCGEGGDMFTFVEKFEGVDFVGALKILAEKAGVELEKIDIQKKEKNDRLYEVMEESTKYFETELEKRKDALKYLEDRGLNEETIKKFRLGYVKDEWRGLFDFLKESKPQVDGQRKQFTDEEIEKVGLIKKTDKGFYDRFRGRIIFPIFDNMGKVVAFSGRIFKDDGKSAKYLNSPETVLFHKSKILYGYNFAKNYIRKRDFSILVEGQMDLVLSHQSGFDNTVATSGTALTGEHLNLLKRLSNKIMLAFDADDAGLNAANKSSKMALREGMEVKLVELPKGMDPADFILKNKKGWISALKNAVHIIEFNLNILLGKEIGQRNLGIKISEIVLPLVSELNNKIEQDYFISKISDKTGIDVDVLKDELSRIGISKNSENRSFSENRFYIEKEKFKTNKKQKAMREISGIIFWQKTLEEPVIDIDENKNRLKKIIGDEMFEKVEYLPEEILNEIIFEAENLYLDSKRLKEKLEELFINLEKEILVEKRDLVSQRLKKVEEGTKEEEELFKEHSKLSQKIEKL